MIALLANPDSGSGGAEDIERVLRARGLDVVRFDLDRAADVAAAAPERVDRRRRRRLDRLAAEAAAHAGAPLGVVPVGTANDFARALGLPDDPAEATELAATGERDRVPRPRQGRPAAVRQRRQRRAIAGRRPQGGWAEGLLGPLSYTVGALRAGLLAQPVEARVAVDGRTAFDGRAWQLIVGLTGAFGGGAEVDSDPADGRLDLVVIEARSRARLVLHGYGLRSGTVEEQEGVVTATGARIEVDTDSDAGFNVDGELVDERRLEFTAEPRAFEVVVGR